MTLHTAGPNTSLFMKYGKWNPTSCVIYVLRYIIKCVIPSSKLIL